jgi:hypothetical protein
MSPQRDDLQNGLTVLGFNCDDCLDHWTARSREHKTANLSVPPFESPKN